MLHHFTYLDLTVRLPKSGYPEIPPDSANPRRPKINRRVSPTMNPFPSHPAIYTLPLFLARIELT